MIKKNSPNLKELENLYEIILALPDKKTAKKFFRDLCTLAELKEMSERFEVAKRIESGQNYREICKQTGVSTATITRVAHWLKNGEGGYLWALKQVEKTTK